MEIGKNKIGKWFFAVVIASIVGIFAVYPQYNLQKLRGTEFQGAFASCDLDEMAYASYLQALIDGRARKNDPYTGRDESAETPQPESLFSIQFFPAYLVAIPARIVGASAATAMPFVSFIAAFLTALAIFWLIVSITGENLSAAVGTLVVIFGGALIVGIGAINGFYENGAAYPFYPFMRRYIPSLAFPFLFSFFACLWNGLQSVEKKPRAFYSLAASLCFAALAFSYFYVWTAAAAVAFSLVLFVLIFRTEKWREDFIFLAVTGAFCLVSLVPYALLLSRRDETMDQAQLLVFTRQPDLLRTIEVVGYIVLALTALALWRGVTTLVERKVYLIAAFAFAPLLVFNQQILTAHSLQPFHYEFYVINYVALLGMVLIILVFWQKLVSRFKTISAVALSMLGIISIVWGYIEAKETTVFWDSVNVRRDEAMPVNKFLREQANGQIGVARQQTTLNLEALQADSQPTVAAQAVLWARHQHVFAGLKDWEENKLRYYQMLYYSDLNADWLRSSLTGCRDIEACMALFGWDRFNARLSANARPLTLGEVEAEVKKYASFVQNFSINEAQNPKLSYVVFYNDIANPMVNIDKWYERGEAKNFGKYSLYEVRLKSEAKSEK